MLRLISFLIRLKLFLFCRSLKNIQKITLYPVKTISYSKNFIIYKGKTKEKVLESYMVVFHESSSVMDAIISKKKILIFETDLFGKYFSKRILYCSI